jgi:hypothetical protein
VREGAADIAPTAPHATFSAPRKGKRPGPQRFWEARSLKIAFFVGFVLSIFVHYEMFPWHLLPKGSVSFQDVEGELTTPVDLLGEETPPPKPPTPPQAPTADPPKQEDGTGLDASAPPKRDAGPKDAGPKGRDAGVDGGYVEDGGPIPLASDEAGAAPVLDQDAAVASAGDAGAGWGGGTDPGILAGAPESGPPNIVLIVNARVTRSHPIGARVGPLLSGIQQWDEFMKGTNIDPVKDGEWLLIYGPSLINTTRDAIVIHYNTSETAIDHAIDAIRQNSHNGAGYDAGVPGVKATLGHADRAPRVFLHFPTSKVVAVVPVDAAHKQAVHWSRNASVLMGKIPQGAAVWVKVMQPSAHMKDPDGDPIVPASVLQLTLWVSPNADGTADVRAEGTCPDAASADAAAQKLRDFFKRQNAGIVRMITRGLITPLEQEHDASGQGLRAEGSKVRLYVRATQEQLEAILGAAAFRLGVNLSAPPASAAKTPAPTPNEPPSPSPAPTTTTSTATTPTVNPPL